MSGLTNSEIAQARFVTRSTVERHLSHACEKLGIDSREELSTALSRPHPPGWARDCHIARAAATSCSAERSARLRSSAVTDRCV